MNCLNIVASRELNIIYNIIKGAILAFLSTFSIIIMLYIYYESTIFEEERKYLVIIYSIALSIRSITSIFRCLSRFKFIFVIVIICELISSLLYLISSLYAIINLFQKINIFSLSIALLVASLVDIIATIINLRLMYLDEIGYVIVDSASSTYSGYIFYGINNA